MYDVSRIYTATESQNTDINNDNKRQRLSVVYSASVKNLSHSLKAQSILLSRVK